MTGQSPSTRQRATLRHTSNGSRLNVSTTPTCHSAVAIRETAHRARIRRVDLFVATSPACGKEPTRLARSYGEVRVGPCGMDKLVLADEWHSCGPISEQFGRTGSALWQRRSYHYQQVCSARMISRVRNLLFRTQSILDWYQQYAAASNIPCFDAEFFRLQCS